MTLLEDVKKAFNTTNLYQILEIDKNCTDNELTKAYFRKALRVHPDKCMDETKKKEQNFKFQVLSKIHCILQNESFRNSYQEHETSFDDSQIDSSFEPREHWTNMFVPDVSSQFYEDVNLSECQLESENRYTLPCRCSGLFSLNINEIFDADGFIVNCDSCSNAIRILIK